VSDALRKRLEPVVGQTFQHKYKGVNYILTVIKSDDGIAFELLGKVYRSPTAACKAIVGNQFVNGRRFWRIDE
jgi:hypothetical protein